MNTKTSRSIQYTFSTKYSSKQCSSYP